jgi:hypothetical protein
MKAHSLLHLATVAQSKRRGPAASATALVS